MANWGVLTFDYPTGAVFDWITNAGSGLGFAGGSPASHSGANCASTSAFSSGTTQGSWRQLATSSGLTAFYFQIWMYVTTLPSAENRFLVVNNSADFTTPMVYITLDNSGVLKLYDEDGQITGTTTVSTGVWFCLETHVDISGSSGTHTVEARVNQTSFASATNRAIGQTPCLGVWLGGNLNSEANTAGSWQFDDGIINDTTGSTMNSWPGGLKTGIVTTAGDGDLASAGRYLKASGSAGASGDWASVTAPHSDDPVFLESSLLNQGEYYAMAATPSEVHSDAVVSCVHVNARHVNDTASTNIGYKTGIKKAASGTLAEAASNITANNSSVWHTNGLNNNQLNANLITYLDPDGGVWTKATLDSMRAGFRTSLDSSASFIRINNFWVTFAYTNPATAVDTLTRALLATL